MAEPTVIAPVGELDITTVGEFRAALANSECAGADRLIVDLSQVSFVDSSCLAAIVEAHHRLRHRRCMLALVAPAGSGAAVALSLGGLRHRLPIFESQQAALQG